MAFKRTLKPVFSTPVVVNVPNDKGGFDKQTFVAVFSRPSESQKEALMGMANAELVRQQLVGWELVDAETGEAVEFTPANVDALLEISPTPMATATAFWQTVQGARAKN